jgi:hypothetical protein
VEAVLEIIRAHDAVLREPVRWDDECNATAVLEDGGRSAIADEARRIGAIS